MRTPPPFLQAGLRTACLAAALSLNKTLRSLDLGGWTWDELGNGCALPFLTLGCCPGTALTCVKVGCVGGWTWEELGNGCALPFLTLGCCPGTALTCVKVWGWTGGGRGGETSCGQ